MKLNIDLKLLSPIIVGSDNELVPIFTSRYAEGIFYASMKWMESQEDFTKFWQGVERTTDTIELKGFYIEDGKIIEDSTQGYPSWIDVADDRWGFEGFDPLDFMSEPICVSSRRKYLPRRVAISKQESDELYKSNIRHNCIWSIVEALNRFCFMRDNWDSKTINSWGPYFLLQKIGGDVGQYVLYGPKEATEYFDNFVSEESVYAPIAEH